MFLLNFNYHLFTIVSTQSFFVRVSAIALRMMAQGVKAKELKSDFVIPDEMLNSTANWLITQQDNMTGRFIESDMVHNRMYEVCVEILFLTKIEI